MTAVAAWSCIECDAFDCGPHVDLTDYNLLCERCDDAGRDPYCLNRYIVTPCPTPGACEHDDHHHGHGSHWAEIGDDDVKEAMDRIGASALDADAIAAVMGDWDQWKHQCHAASLHLVRSGILPDGAVVARGFCPGVGGQHSWVTIGDPYATPVVVIDVTLWSYTAAPKVWVGIGTDRGHRPHGAGDIFEHGRPGPAVGEPIVLPEPDGGWSRDAALFLDLLGPLDRDGWVALAHAPVGGWPAGEIFRAMDAAGMGVLVPIDVMAMTTGGWR